MVGIGDVADTVDTADTADTADTSAIQQRYSRYSSDTVTPLGTPPYGKYNARYSTDTAQIQRDTADT
eukprot:6336948-Prymnesium_polylepis.2